jgi:uncharacterized membrane protein YoaT (DUF817 family)
MSVENIVSAIGKLPYKSSAADPLLVSFFKWIAHELAPFAGRWPLPASVQRYFYNTNHQDA